MRSEVKASSRSEISRPPPRARARRVGSASPESGLSRCLYPDIWRETLQSRCFSVHWVHLVTFTPQASVFTLLWLSVLLQDNKRFKKAKHWQWNCCWHEERHLSMNPPPQLCVLNLFLLRWCPEVLLLTCSTRTRPQWSECELMTVTRSSDDSRLRSTGLAHVESNRKSYFQHESTRSCVWLPVWLDQLCAARRSFCPRQSKQTDSVYIYVNRAERRFWDIWHQGLEHRPGDSDGTWFGRDFGDLDEIL